MAIKIKFDSNHNVITPIFALATRNGTKLGVVQASNISMSDSFNSYFELDFQVHKYIDGKKYHLWDELTDLKLIWCKDWDVWFEINVEIQIDDSDIKNVHCVSLGEAELSQVNLYNIEINTEDDILRDDYEPTVLFDETNENASLLNRIMDKMPHYVINYVDASIASIQRSFSFHNISIYDAMQEIASEINCIFIFHSGSNTDGSIRRAISVYDLESYCIDCGTRGNFISNCSECNSDNIVHGYGDDTNIFISKDNLADSITFKTDVDSVKNCFRLEAGDDLMTATIRNCNPNGSGYLWDIPDELRADMSDELNNKLKEYDEAYDYYVKESTIGIDSDILSKYNNIIDKYIAYDASLKKITSPIIGYSSLMKAYYDTVDAYLVLHDSMMPVRELPETSASNEASKLKSASLSPVAVMNLQSCSESTVSNSVLNMARVIVDSRYKLSVENGTITKSESEDGTVTGITWTGRFKIENYSDDTDFTNTSNISVTITDDLTVYTKQKLDKALDNSISEDANGIVSLFDMTLPNFMNEIKKYCLDSLVTFHDSCQTCINILIEQGVANASEWEGKTPDLYNELYIPYYEKLFALEDEIAIRESDLSVIIATYDEDGDILEHGMQSYLDTIRYEIQSTLDTELFLGEKLWHELIAYRREDTYSNDNFISDGLDNNKLFERALEFIDNAKKEIYKSSHLQHSISASLQNLLAMKEFEPILDSFATGNWLRIEIDGKIYRLRLLYYSIQYNSLDDIDVEFSDITKCYDGISDSESILDQAASMVRGYDEVAKQANKGNKGKEQLDNWVEKGLSLTTMKIVGVSDNIDVTVDKHGMLFKEYLPVTDTYDERQLKIINKGLYITSDNWKTARAGIGNFMFYNPISCQTEEAYGVIADTLVGNLILSEKVGIYNPNSSIVIDEGGIIIIADNTTGDDELTPTTFQLQKKYLDEDGNEVISKLLYVDENGDLILNGSLRVNTGDDEDNKTLGDAFDSSGIDEQINTAVRTEYDSLNGTINERTSAVLQEALDELERYKAEVGQYFEFGKDEGLIIGANANGIESAFKTTLDNKRLAFKENDTTVAYISNNQLNILNAIVRNALILGKVVFMPRRDSAGNHTGVSVVWNEDFVESLEKEYTITRQPSSITVDVGKTATFVCTTSDSGQVYNWQISKDGGDTWENYSSGSSTLSYTPSSAEEDGYLFRCYARYEDGQILISDSAILTVNDTSGLYVVTQPTTVYIELGDEATFSCSTNKSSVEHTFKWQYSINEGSTWSNISTSIINSNYSKISITNIDNSYKNAIIRCVITCGNESVTTDATARIIIEEEEAPVLTITRHPQDVTINPGDSTTFTAGASTTSTTSSITYTWMYSNNDGSSWSSGNTGSTYTVRDSGGNTHNRLVKFIAGDGVNSVHSNSARITVSSTISITTSPQSVTIDKNGTASFSVAAKTNATSKSLSYQWMVKTTSYGSWENVSTGTTYSIKDNNNSIGGYRVKCVITDGISTVETSEVSITVNAPSVNIITQPNSVVISPGDTAEFSISASTQLSGATLSYSWEYLTSGSTNWTVGMTGNTSGSTFRILDTSGNLDGCQVRCIVSDGAYSIISNIVTITVLDDSTTTSIVTQPTDVTVSLLDTATFNIVATGQNLTYKWEYKKLGAVTSQWSTLGSTATVSRTIYDEGWDMASVRCTISGADGISVVSNEVHVHLNPVDSDKITISTQPVSSLQLSRGSSSTLSVVASGTGLTYQWQTKNYTQYSINAEYSNITNATSSTYNATATTSTFIKSQYFRCVIRDSSGNVHVSSACHMTYK